MKRLFKRAFQVATALLLLAALAVPAAGQTIKVTFLLNTATNLDTLTSKGFVEIRGAQNGKTGSVLPGGKTIDWSKASDLEMSNIGGDYWTITFDMNPNDTLNYKFWTGFNPDRGTYPDDGWEGPFNPSNGINTDTRTFISGNRDTTLALQYYHPAGSTVDQFFRPFASKPDSVAIFFRVNMGGVTEAKKFDPSVNGPVGVRGNDQTSGKVLDWGTTKVILTRETNSVDNGSFWSGVAYVPKDSVTARPEQAYKFFVENKGGIDWEGGDNRTFRYPVGLQDTTLAWVDFDRRRPTGKPLVSSRVNFRLNMASLGQVGLFDRSKGDRVIVLGPKGFNPGSDGIQMNFVPALQAWAASEVLENFAGDVINYKYFVVWDSSRFKPASANYIPLLDKNYGWEEPGITGGGNRTFTWQNAADQNASNDVENWDGIPSLGIITTPISVTWNVDMRPATDPATNPNSTRLFRPGTDSVWISIDVPLFAVSQGFSPAARNYRLTDPDGDQIYSGTFTLKTPVWYAVGFQVSYSQDPAGTIIRNGGGFDKGRRYYQFIRPASISSTGPTWPTEYNFPTVVWKATDLSVEDPPALVTAVEEKPTTGVPLSFALEPNYPNPFNPETSIRYQVARTTEVKIGVYNVMGQLVKTLVNETKTPGHYTLAWNGDNAQGKPVATGIYFLKMEAGDFTRTHKMALVR